MLPFLKKPSDKAAAPLVPPWHPNFRNFERLPDTKVIRTSFFVNVASLLVALSAVIYFGHQEFTRFSLNRQIADWETQIEGEKRTSTQAIAQFKKFQEEEKKVTELEAFLAPKLVVSDFVVRIAETLPRNVALTSLEYREAGVTLRGIVRGAPELATQHVSAYLEALRKDQAVAPRFGDIVLTGITRDPVTARLSIEIYFKFPVAKEVKK